MRNPGVASCSLLRAQVHFSGQLGAAMDQTRLATPPFVTLPNDVSSFS
jgi:hypothetical protein